MILIFESNNNIGLYYCKNGIGWNWSFSNTGWADTGSIRTVAWFHVYKPKDLGTSSVGRATLFEQFGKLLNFQENMANFSQLRRRQSSREILYRSQLSEEFEERRRHHSVSGSRPNTSASTRYSHWINEGPEENEEISSLMWEMRPRYATSAGELKRHRNREVRRFQLALPTNYITEHDATLCKHAIISFFVLIVAFFNRVF